jgi:hypothetical protein
MKKKNYTRKDIKQFDRMLTKAELKGFDNYNRNIGRVELQDWLKGFTESAKDEMWQIVKDM